MKAKDIKIGMFVAVGNKIGEVTALIPSKGSILFFTGIEQNPFLVADSDGEIKTYEFASKAEERRVMRVKGLRNETKDDKSK